MSSPPLSGPARRAPAPRVEDPRALAVPTRLEAYALSMPGVLPPSPVRRWSFIQPLGGGRKTKTMAGTYSMEPVPTEGGIRLHLHQQTPILYGVSEEMEGELLVRDDLLRTPISWQTQSSIRRGDKPYPRGFPAEGAGTFDGRRLLFDGQSTAIEEGGLTSTWSLLAGLPALVHRADPIGPFSFLDELTVLHTEVRLARAPEPAKLPWGEAAALWRLWGPSLPGRYLYLSRSGDLLVFASVGKCYWAVGT